MAIITLLIRERDIAAGLAKCDSDVVLPLEASKIDLEKAEQGIRSTGRYRLLLRGPEDLVKDCAKWRLSLNGKELDAVPHWNKGQRQVEIPAEERIFKDLLAFALFSLRLDPSAGDQETLFAPPVKVFLDGHSGDQIKEMSNYVTEHAQGILVNRKAPKIIFTKVEPGNTPDFSDVVDFLRDIVQTYQFDADYFRLNSRSRIKLEGRVDAMEKLRYFTAETLRFISMHPEELVPASSSTGIRYGGLSLEPVRTWIQGDKVDRNVYENRIVLGFLWTVINHTEELIKQTSIGNIPKEENSATTKLTDSADLVQRTNKEKLQEMAEALTQLNNRLRRLYVLYKEFMGAERENITRVPEPTAVFLSIPAYNRIYNLLHRWFALREVTLEKNAFFMDAWRSSRAYEYYCLIRLIEEIKAKGYVLRHQEEYFWKNPSESLQNDSINNIYYLERGEEKVTVYYEPVIGCYLQRESGLLLFKNSTGFLNEFSSGLRFVPGNTESRYTPDYVVKYESKGTAKYLIADAKFSKQDEVVALELITLLFKYRISISPARKSDVISGLSIYCGKETNRFAPLPLFNVQNPITHVAKPSSLSIIPIMPSSKETLLPAGFLDA